MSELESWLVDTRSKADGWIEALLRDVGAIGKTQDEIDMVLAAIADAAEERASKRRRPDGHTRFETAKSVMRFVRDRARRAAKGGG